MARFPAVTKAVIPAAGLGTRFLPVTKAIPKEMLPVVDKPAIQYVVEEAVAAGLRDILMVTGRAKGALEDHFDRAPELEQALKAKGDDERLARIFEPTELATVHYTRQSIPKGLGHAVLCAAHHVGDEPFAVLLGDDFIHPDDPLLRRMIEVRDQFGGSVVALMQVDSDQVSQYGCAAIELTETKDVVTLTDLVEKPAPADAPSNWIIIGRYVCDPAVECAASSSAAAGSTPATRSTTCAPWSSSRWNGGTWLPSSCRGCGSTWTASRDRHGSGGGPSRAGARRDPPDRACPARAGSGRGSRARRGRRGNGAAPGGHQAGPGPDRAAGGERPRGGARPPGAAGRGDRDRQRTQRAGQPADPRPDLGVQHLHARGRGPAGGRCGHQVPRRGRPGDRARPDRGPGRPG